MQKRMTNSSHSDLPPAPVYHPKVFSGPIWSPQMKIFWQGGATAVNSKSIMQYLIECWLAVDVEELAAL